MVCCATRSITRYPNFQPTSGTAPGLSAYARAMQCPVLTQRMLLASLCGAGSDVASDASGLRACYAVSGTDRAHAAPRLTYLFMSHNRLTTLPVCPEPRHA
eukprot:3528031-Rhodomonas_salina.2